MILISPNFGKYPSPLGGWVGFGGGFGKAQILSLWAGAAAPAPLGAERGNLRRLLLKFSLVEPLSNPLCPWGRSGGVPWQSPGGRTVPRPGPSVDRVLTQVDGGDGGWSALALILQAPWGRVLEWLKSLIMH